MNVFSCVIDALDKDSQLIEIQKLVADVGRLHITRKIPKKAFNQLRGVFLDCLIGKHIQNFQFLICKMPLVGFWTIYSLLFYSKTS